jgi:hypothetical protein
VARGTAMAHLRTGMVIDPVHDLDLGADGQKTGPSCPSATSPVARSRPTAGNPPVGAACARPPGA